MKKALIHDWLVTYAGSERCVESFTTIWNDFDVYSLIDFLNENDRDIILKGKYAHTSFIQKLPKSKNNYRNYLPLFPFAIEQFDLSEYDFILSSSHSVAKGVLTRPDQLHISYIYSPIRYAWDLYHQYLNESSLNKGIKGMVAKYFLHKIRLWDYSTANRPDYYLCLSKFIAKRIKKIYGKEADVIYPPVNTDLFSLNDKKENYYLTSSRMVPYKKIDLIVESFSNTNHKLVVIGDGPDYDKIKKKAKKNIELLGFVNQNEMIEITKKAKAFIFAAEEDFGIAPIEAQACGTPVIAFGKGGVLETIEGVFVEDNIENGNTGIFFRQQNIKSILEAVDKFEAHSDMFIPNIIRNHSLRFSKDRFENEFKQKVENIIEKWRNL